MVISSSRVLYANKREVVAKIVTDLHTPTPQPEKPQKNNQNNAQKGAQPQNRPAPQASAAPFEVRPPKKFDTPRNQEQRPQQSFDKKPQQPERKPEMKRPQPAPTKSPEDLRSILSKMTQAPNAPQKSDGTTTKTPASEVPAKNDLKNALASVMQQQPAQPTVTPAPTPVQTPPQRATATPAPLTHTRRAAPSFTESPSNTIDESVVKRMLREEKQDRTPFS